MEVVFYDKELNCFFTFSNKVKFDYYLSLCPILDDSLFLIEHYFSKRN